MRFYAMTSWSFIFNEWYKKCINKYEGVFRRVVYLVGTFRGEIHHGRVWQAGIFRGGVLLVPK